MRPNILFAAFVGALLVTAGQRGPLAQGINLDTAAIEQATGLKGQLIAGLTSSSKITVSPINIAPP